jgi:hypothetical protein
VRGAWSHCSCQNHPYWTFITCRLIATAQELYNTYLCSQPMPWGVIDYRILGSDPCCALCPTMCCLSQGALAPTAPAEPHVAGSNPARGTCHEPHHPSGGWQRGSSTAADPALAAARVPCASNTAAHCACRQQQVAGQPLCRSLCGAGEGLDWKRGLGAGRSLSAGVDVCARGGCAHS